MRREFTGKRIILTGASGSIGRATAVQLAKAGARLALAARTAEPLNQLADSLKPLGGEAVVVPTDITQPDERARLINTVVEKFGGLDILINNAGLASWGHFATSTPAILRQLMDINFFAPAELTRLAVPHLMSGAQPVVLNVASLCGRKGMPAWPEHSASKHAIVGMTEALRGEFVRFGIDVLMVIPGLVRSDNLGKHLLRVEGRANLDFANATPPDEVADAIVRALRKNTRETHVGKDARRLLRFNRFFPRITDWFLARRVRKLYPDQPKGN
jgi:short-subunit dehydrogenase